MSLLDLTTQPSIPSPPEQCDKKENGENGSINQDYESDGCKNTATSIDHADDIAEDGDREALVSEILIPDSSQPVNEEIDYVDENSIIETGLDVSIEKNIRPFDSDGPNNLNTEEQVDAAVELSGITADTTESTTVHDGMKGKVIEGMNIEEDGESGSQPHKKELFSAIDLIFKEADKDTVTVGDVNRSLQKKFGVRMKKTTRKMVKSRLLDLVSGNIISDDGHDDNDDSNNDINNYSDHNNSNDESNQINKNKKKKITSSVGKKKRESGRRRKQMNKKVKHHESDEYESDNSDNSSSSSQYESNSSPIRIRKSNRTSGKGKSKGRAMSHARIHAETQRKKLVDEANVRSEELRAEKERTVNEEDTKRAELIRKRFETDTEELKEERLQERRGLLSRLGERRMELLLANDTEIDIKENIAANINTDDNILDRESDEIPNTLLIGKHNTSNIAEPCLTANEKVSVEKIDINNTVEADLCLEVIVKRTDGKGNNKDTNSNNTHNNKDNNGNPDDNDDYDDDDDDDELEVLDGMGCAGSKTLQHVHDSSTSTGRKNKSQSPTSIVDFFGFKKGTSQINSVVAKKQGALANPRTVLRNKLRAKQFQAGNGWLARELGYNTHDDHIRECQEVEMNKRKQILKIEEKRLRLFKEKNNDPNYISPPSEENGNIEDDPETSSEIMPRTIVNESEHLESEDEENEEDEEIALARKIEKEQMGNHIDHVESDKADENFSHLEGTQGDQGLSIDHRTIRDEILNTNANSKTKCNDIEIENQATSRLEKSDEANECKVNIDPENVKVSNYEGYVSKGVTGKIELEGEQAKTLNDGSSVEFDNCEDNVDEDREFEGTDEQQIELTEGENLVEQTEADSSKQNKPRNAAWKAMLKKESDIMKKRKAKGSKGYVDAEAEEEEEEEGVAGLEEFGFTVKGSKKDDEDEEGGEDEANADDMEDIVDEISDNEGDDEAGDAGRKALEAKEEKKHHKEMLRRIREGYDGRRGGIAGGGTARGNHRFDQLVSADNRDDARRLGLLNDDEIESEDDGDIPGTKDNGEVEDETALLDKMLKNRHMNRANLPDERFSDDEEDEGEDGEKACVDSDNEDRQQEHLAKRFAKRARMNRVLETYGADSEFSQSRLLDEDETLKTELSTIRHVHQKRTRQISSSSSLPVDDGSRSSSGDYFGANKSKSNESNDTKSLISASRNLSINLCTNRSLKRKRTSFLGGKQRNSQGRSNKSTQGAASLGHVLFQTGETKKAHLSRSSTFPRNIKQKSNTFTTLNSDDQTVNKPTFSLWNKVSVNGFRRSTTT